MKLINWWIDKVKNEQIYNKNAIFLNKSTNTAVSEHFYINIHEKLNISTLNAHKKRMRALVDKWNTEKEQLRQWK